MRTIFINGKFTAQRTTGVQRVAARLTQALDAQLSDGDADRWILLCPPGSTAPVLRHIAVRQIGPPGLPRHLWEQLVLPFAARGGLLVNLAGAAPYVAARQVCLLHDAAVFDHPRAYTRAFVGWYRQLFRRLARTAARLLTVSAFSQARLALHLKLQPGQIGVLNNGCDHLDEVVPDLGVLTRHALVGTRCLLAVASANPTKNLASLLTAYARLPADPLLRLVIVGGANERVFAAGKTLDPPQVVRVGPVGDAQLVALYLHAAGFVLPSLYEGFGIVALEAMRCGCPVAAAQAAAIPEVCGDAALYFDPQSVPAIADAMQRLLSDTSLVDQLRAAGQARACIFRWSDAAAVLRAEVLHLTAKEGAA